MPAVSVLALLALGASPAPSTSPSPSGWTAVQTHFDSKGEPKARGRITYVDHRLEISTPSSTMVLEFPSGDLTIMNPATKQWSRVTLEMLVRKRDEMLADLEAKIAKMPAELQTSMREQLERQKEAGRTPLKLEKTDEVTRVGDVVCTVHRWKNTEGKGEACLASKLPVNVGPFLRDVVSLGSRMSEMGAGQAASSFAFLEFGRDGFPIRTQRTIQVGPGQWFESKSTISGFQPARGPIPDPPADYAETEFEAFIEAAAEAAAPR